MLIISEDKLNCLFSSTPTGPWPPIPAGREPVLLQEKTVNYPHNVIQIITLSPTIWEIIERLDRNLTTSRARYSLFCNTSPKGLYSYEHIKFHTFLIPKK